MALATLHYAHCVLLALQRMSAPRCGDRESQYHGLDAKVHIMEEQVTQCGLRVGVNRLVYFDISPKLCMSSGASRGRHGTLYVLASIGFDRSLTSTLRQ